MTVYNLPFPLNADMTLGASTTEHVESCKSTTVGPMPPLDFLDRFLPVRGTPKDHSMHRLPSTDAFKSVPRVAATAEGISSPLIAALNECTPDKFRCPGFVFDSTATRSPPDHPNPHICCYKPHNLDAAKRSQYYDLAYAEFFINVSPDPLLDFFDDPLDTADRATHELLSRFSKKSSQALVEEHFGQHLVYVVEVLSRQSRNFLFTVDMHGSMARFLRWDRSGCVVSESFDVCADPEYLCDFLWRFSKTNDAGRGHDPSVEHATPVEERAFRNAVRAYARTQLSPDEDLEQEVRLHYAPGRVFAVQILSQGKTAREENWRRFLFSRPVASPGALLRNATRGYWAVDASTGRCSSSKTAGATAEASSSWRERSCWVAPGWRAECTDLGMARRRVVLGTPVELASAAALVDASNRPDWACLVNGQIAKLWCRKHYRLVLSTVGRSFTTLRDTKELLHSCYDAFIAMRDAFKKNRRLHRDISIGNIVLVQEPDSEVRKGYLIDWETSSKVDSKGNATQRGRAPHNLTVAELTKRWKIFSHKDYAPNGKAYGGVYKLENAKSRKHTRDIVFGSPALSEWLDTMMAFHSPLKTHGDEFRGKWTGWEVEKFWKRFLRTHTLETSNRPRHSSKRLESASKSSKIPSAHASQAQTGREATVQRGPRDELPSSATPKRGRLPSPDPRPAQKKRRVGATEPAAPVPRRSARILGSQEQANPRLPPIVIPSPTDIRRSKAAPVLDGSRPRGRRRSP
ncbi:uncharacterized protein BXZ73DRAFT_77406 [Epithele typhae]|uniref:uncharacterized protein n=1 Tax=Epithele typhae TaxID=378194 RepID=UPI002007C94A|nr:uncharacterized protein BXZ73DRAFT_77406 [Epithele typhae]KAH9932688.1 hypothetical protein BXZ73DRAFT_77406 [Epithele typhae]